MGRWSTKISTNFYGLARKNDKSSSSKSKGRERWATGNFHGQAHPLLEESAGHIPPAATVKEIYSASQNREHPRFASLIYLDLRWKFSIAFWSLVGFLGWVKLILGRFRDAVLPDFSRFLAGSDDYLNTFSMIPVMGDTPVDMSQGHRICVRVLVCYIARN